MGGPSLSHVNDEWTMDIWRQDGGNCPTEMRGSPIEEKRLGPLALTTESDGLSWLVLANQVMALRISSAHGMEKSSPDPCMMDEAKGQL